MWLAAWGLLSAARLQSQQVERDLDLLPWPAKVHQHPGSLSLPSPLGVNLGPGAEELTSAVRDLLLRWEQGTNLQLLPTPETARLAPWLDISIGGDRWAASATVKRDLATPETVDESYLLSARADGVLIDAPTIHGARRGLATLEQLLELGPNGFAVPFVEIDDRPRFTWRGLLLDVCRHWLPKELVLRTLDAMAAVKLNVLHWHLTEDQAFRIESKRYPLLHEAGSDGNYYTQDDVRDVVAKATSLGIRVVPEFDVPGHTTSWLVAYPEELSPIDQNWRLAETYDVQPAALDPTRESTFELLEGFFAEMAQLFPDPVVHIGGDEVNGEVWESTPRIRRYMEQHSIDGVQQLQARFTQRMVEMLERLGKQPMVWDEALGPGLDRSVIVQAWRDDRALRAAVAHGHQTVFSSSYYLDHMLSAGEHYAVDPAAVLNSPSSAAEAADQALLIGGEACLWTELISEENAESRLWPRAAAIAERLWSPRSVTDTDDLYRRLEALDHQLETLGVRHRSYLDPMLRRLTEGRSTAALRTLVETVEPVRFYARHGSRRYTTQTPLDRLVDAASPESRVSRELDHLVDVALAGGEVTHLRQLFRSWSRQEEQLGPVLEGRLAEVAPLSRKLASLGRLGLEALDILTGSSTPSPGWASRARRTIAASQRPDAELTIAVWPGVERLVAAVAEPSPSLRRN